MARLSILLADTSAWHRASHPQVTSLWRQELDADRVGITPPVRLEVLYSARNAREYADRSLELDALHQIPCGEDAFARALEVQRMLGERRALHHRSVKIVDLLVAAAAELAGATVWHYDEDYDRIASVTSQPTLWIAARGTL